MTDHLKSLPVQQAAQWYYRLAASIAVKKVDKQIPLASVFLKHWLDNRTKDSIFQFTAPAYLQKSPRVINVQKYHRSVFLTEQKARIGKTTKWAGVVPRLKGISPYAKWNVGHALTMRYESLCDIAPNVIDIIKIQRSGTDAERDLLTSLRGFQLKSEVILRGKQKSNKNNIFTITFQNWKCQVNDYYNWNYKEHFTVPNPDYGSTTQDAVRPGDSSLRVYHSNAKRLEDAQLAAPYVIQSKHWGVTDATMLANSDVDSNRKL